MRAKVLPCRQVRREPPAFTELIFEVPYSSIFSIDHLYNLRCFFVLDDANPSFKLLLNSFDDVQLLLFGVLECVLLISDSVELDGHGHAVPHAYEEPNVL